MTLIYHIARKENYLNISYPFSTKQFNLRPKFDLLLY